MKAVFAVTEGRDPCDAQAIWLRRLLPALQAAGVQTEVILYAAAPPDLCESLVAFRNNGITCHVTRNLGTAVNFTKWALRCLKRANPDVFVPQHCIYPLYAGRWARESGIPTVCVLHSDDAPCRSLLTQFGGDNNPYQTSAFVAVSTAIAALAQAAAGDKCIVQCIPYGVPIPQAKAAFSTSKLRICYVGRIVQKQKRVMDVVRQFGRVCRQFSDVEAYIWGEGQQLPAVRAYLAQECAGLPIFCPGSLGNEDAVKAIRSCQAVVLLSDYEGTPNVFLEGMAAGVVPIARRIGGGTEELIEDGVSGILLREDEYALVRAIELLRNRERWAAISAGARRRVRHRYSLERECEQWGGLLEMLANRHSKMPLRVPVRLQLPPPDPVLARERRWPPGLNGAALLIWRVKQIVDDFRVRKGLR